MLHINYIALFARDMMNHNEEFNSKIKSHIFFSCTLHASYFCVIRNKQKQTITFNLFNLLKYLYCRNNFDKK